MRRLGFILLTGICLLVFVVPIRSQEISDIYTDSLSVDSFAIDSFDPDPEWYVAPLVREADFAPRRAAAANCPVDSVLTFNVDSILSEVTVYEYGDTTRTMVWTVNADGSRVGKSRTESASTATTSYSATYAWDAATNDWKGTSKEEHTYNSANKETLRILYNTWLNNDWLADTKYTWTYDASNREHEYSTYTRNTSTNQLVLSKQRIREYNAAGKTTLDIQYTAHNGTDWSAGTKKIYDYDASGNQIEYTYYSSLSNGNWVGSTHEVWTYTSGKKTYYEKQTWSNGDWVNSTKEIWAFNAAGKQTLHEKYNGSSSTWSLTLQENSDYDAAGNNTLVENYNVSSGVFSGSKKEAYTYNSANKKTGTFTYKWTNGAWVYNQWTVTGYDAAGNTIESCKYNWSNDAWVGSGTRTLQTFNSSKKVTEKITQSWPTNATDWINKTCTTTVYSGANVTQEAYYTWQDDAWLGTKRSDYHYNAKNQNDTIKTYTNNGTDWIYSNRTVKTFNAAGTNIMTHNAKWENNAWVMTSMTRTDIIMDGICQLLKATWHCGNDSVWIGDQKDTTYYSSTYKPIFTARYTSWANNDWVPSYKVDYEYDDEDRTILTQRYNWSDNQWKGYYRYEYEYNAQGQQTSSAYYSGWNASTSTWVGSSKITTEYSETGKTSSLLTYEWKNSAWLPKNNTIFEYDEAGNTVEQITQVYTNNAWVNSIRYEKAYKASTLMISNDYTWLNNAWQITHRSEKVYDEDTQAKLRREITGSWNSTTGILQSFTDKYYAYACDPKYYTIRFVNYDGTELSSESIVEGETPSYNGEEPTKQEDAEFTYSFASWTPSVVPVTGNATYTATYTATKRTYTITWLNEDGSQLGQETLEYGATPSHVDMNKENTAEYTYTFIGWTPGIGIVTGDATYTATFDTTKNTYTVTWLNEDGSELSHETLEYGANPQHADLTKDATAEYTYTFTGWTPQIATVTGNATYTATFEATKRKYTVTWLNEDGSILEQEELEFGTTPAHADINKENTAEYTYEFAGWTPTILPVVSNISYQATFTATKNSYTITFKDEDGSVISSANVVYGAMPVEPTAPTKPADSENTYTFAGWTPTVVAVTGEATYTATYISTTNSYTITFKNEDGTTISTASVEYGTMPVAPSAPTKQSTAEYTYTFSGWTPTVAEVTGDAVYTATFTATKNKYLITFKDEDGSVLKSEELEYGAMPTAPANPTKAATAEWTYTFAGWNPQVTSVTGNATYQATFTATKRSYTIVWLNEDGTEISHETLEYGVLPTHDDVTKQRTAEWTYSFIGWSPDIQSVTGDAAYTAQFNATKNSYYITWLNSDNSQLDQTLVEYGVVPTHTAPTKEATDEHSYFFAGWTPEVVAVTGEATYKATFSETTKVYTITWLNEDGSEISHETLEYGATPSHVDPTKEATDEFTYTFAGWNPAVTSVTGDASYTATFSAIKNKYTITFKNEDGSDLQISEVEYGTTPTYNGVEPGKAATAQYTYTFAGWDKTVVPVVGEATYIAQFIATVNKYTITFKNEDGSILSTQTLNYGAMPISMELAKQSTAEYTYSFAGWSPSIVPVTDNATYTAIFSATKNSYTITWLNEDGSEIEHETLEYGATPAHADVTKENTAEFTYTFTGWTPAIVSITGDASYTATFSATKNKYTITWLNDDDTQIDQTTVEYGVVPTHDDPSKAATAEFTYTFAGWNNTPIAVTGPATYKATYTSAKNSYTITWLDDDNSALGSTTVEYGVVPTHEDPTKQPTAQYGYTFAGWSPAITSVTGNATYKATYTDTINQYTISWLNDVGTLVDQTKVAYGTTPAHANIYKESDDQFDYTFVGWTPTIVPVTGDASYSAIFTTAGKSYTVTFYFEDGVTVLDQMTLPYGAIPSTPYIPSIPSDANHTYTFSGWSPEIAPVTGDISYVPTFTAIPNQYTVIFRNYNGKELQRKKVDYGTVPEYEGDEPSRPATNSYTWAFEGWTPELVAVIGDATYTAVYSKVMNTYTILFYDEDGTTLLDEVTVEHGQKPTTSVIPTKEADEEYRYTFAGWSPKIAKATSDAEYTATYFATPKTQGLNNTEAEGAAIKVIIEDKIYIRRGGNTYSIDGQRVK